MEYGTSSRRATKLLKADRWAGEAGGERRGAGGGSDEKGSDAATATGSSK